MGICARVHLPVLVCLALLTQSCGSDELGAATESESVPVAGMYKVEGFTVELDTGAKRAIEGTIILADEGTAYTATFDLATTLPGSDSRPAEVIGKGDGVVDGRTLTGTARTQIVASVVPNVDPRFPFIPHFVSTRVVSTTNTTIASDGSVAVEIESRAEAGQSYSPTRTTLRGMRVERWTGASSATPPVAAAPAAPTAD